MELFNATLNRFHRGRRVETGIHSGVLLSIFKTDFWDCGIPDFRSVMANGLEEWIRLNDAQVMKSVPKPTSETSSTQLFTRKLGEHPYSLIKRRALVGLSLSLYSIDFPIQVFKSRQLNWILKILVSPNFLPFFKFNQLVAYNTYICALCRFALHCFYPSQLKPHF